MMTASRVTGDRFLFKVQLVMVHKVVAIGFTGDGFVFSEVQPLQTFS